MRIIKLFLLLSLSILSLRSMGQYDGNQTQPCEINNTYFSGDCRQLHADPNFTGQVPSLHCYPGASVDLDKLKAEIADTKFEPFQITNTSISFSYTVKGGQGYEKCSGMINCLKNGTWTKTSSDSNVYVCKPTVAKK